MVIKPIQKNERHRPHLLDLADNYSKCFVLEGVIFIEQQDPLQSSFWTGWSCSAPFRALPGPFD